MITSLSLIFLVGLALAGLCALLKMPRIIGMLVTGIVLGPFCLNMLDESILLVSSDLRRMALIIILIKAGLALKLDDIKAVGLPAILLSFVPALCEILAFYLIAPLLLDINANEALLMGTVLAAVSPAVVIPRMDKLIEEGYGTSKSIPEMIIAGSSVDDIVVIVLFTSFLSLVQGGSMSAMALLDIPLSILSGIVVGVIVGYVLSMFFESFYTGGHHIRNSMKVIIILGFAFLLVSIEECLKDVFAFSGLLATITMAVVIGQKSIPYVRGRLSQKYGKLWIAAEVILFVLVGAAVDIRYTLEAGGMAIAMILIGLIFRSVGTMLSLIPTHLNMKERLYTTIAYIPKATVQAAIGSVPLAMGLPCGKIILSVAVMAILITAPLGAIGMDITYKKLLSKDR